MTIILKIILKMILKMKMVKTQHSSLNIRECRLFFLLYIGKIILLTIFEMMVEF